RVTDPLRLSEIDEEQGQAFRPLRALLERRGPRDEHHEVALLDAGDEDLAAPDPVSVAVPFRERRDACEIAPGVRLREGEALHPQIAAREVGQVLLPDWVGREPGDEEGQVVL